MYIHQNQRINYILNVLCICLVGGFKLKPNRARHVKHSDLYLNEKYTIYTELTDTFAINAH